MFLGIGLGDKYIYPIQGSIDQISHDLLPWLCFSGGCQTSLFASYNAAVDYRELFLGPLAMIGRHSFGEHRGTTPLAAAVQSDHSSVG